MTLRYSRGETAFSDDLSPQEWPWPLYVNKLRAPAVGAKDGPYDVRGLCEGDKRSDDSLKAASLFLFDADGSTHAKTDAPGPEKSFAVLAAAGWTCVLHTTYSHRLNGHGNRWRASFALSRAYTKAELPALEWKVRSTLHAHGLEVAPAVENLKWSQPWYLPRVPDEDGRARFQFHEHDGQPLDVDQAVAEFAQVQVEPEPERANGHGRDAPEPDDREPFFLAFEQARPVPGLLSGTTSQARPSLSTGMRAWSCPASTRAVLSTTSPSTAARPR